MTVENTVVALTEPVGKWPIGTEGTVVSVMAGGVLIEVSDEDGYTQDLIACPDSNYRVVKATKDHGTQEFVAQ